MLNILGEADGKEGEQIAKELIDKAYQIPGEIFIQVCAVLKVQDRPSLHFSPTTYVLPN